MRLISIILTLCFVVTASPAFGSMSMDEIKDSLDVFGRLRLRHESNFSWDGMSDWSRERMKFRLGIKGKLHEDLSFQARLSTGASGGAGNPWHDLGNGMGRFSFEMDNLFVAYNPHYLPQMTVLAGKFAYPFWRTPAYGFLIWALDIHPEGIAAVYKREDVGPFNWVTLKMGEFMVLSQTQDSEATLFAGELMGDLNFNDRISLTTGMAYFLYNKLNPDVSTAISDLNRGNMLNGSDFVSKFELLHPKGALAIRFLPYRLTLFGEYMHNLAAETPDDTGYMFGMAFGSNDQKKVLAWKVFYQWQHIEQEALFSVVAGEDFPLAVNFEGHYAGASLRIMPNAVLVPWVMTASRLNLGTTPTTDSDKHQIRARLCLIMSF